MVCAKCEYDVTVDKPQPNLMVPLHIPRDKRMRCNEYVIYKIMNS